MPNWEGLPGSSGEHRTTGQRAFCLPDSEWCYPDTTMYCSCCERTAGLSKDDLIRELQAGIDACAVAPDDSCPNCHEWEYAMRTILENYVGSSDGPA